MMWIPRNVGPTHLWVVVISLNCLADPTRAEIQLALTETESIGGFLGSVRWLNSGLEIEIAQ